jgi:hypothetical protein
MIQPTGSFYSNMPSLPNGFEASIFTDKLLDDGCGYRYQLRA